MLLQLQVAVSDLRKTREEHDPYILDPVLQAQKAHLHVLTFVDESYSLESLSLAP